jgi:hypothetical protein
MLTQLNVTPVHNSCCQAIDVARRQFNAALLRGNLMLAVRGLLGHRSGLRLLPGFSGFRRAYSRGMVVVPIQRIVGSESGNRDFDRFFHPLNERVRSRWIDVAASLLKGRWLPPVELIEVDGFYYIRDGHHRVSAAVANGQKDMEALVTVWER